MNDGIHALDLRCKTYEQNPKFIEKKKAFIERFFLFVGFMAIPSFKFRDATNYKSFLEFFMCTAETSIL